MKKIAILSNQIEKNNTLIALLNALFPECEICISKMDYLNSHSSGCRAADAENSERRIHHGKKS
jgi:hypothetical protein